MHKESAVFFFFSLHCSLHCGTDLLFNIDLHALFTGGFLSLASINNAMTLYKIIPSVPYERRQRN